MGYVTDISAVQDQVQKFWAPLMGQELKEATLLGALVNRDVDVPKFGDTIRITEILDAAGTLQTIGVDADVFDTEQLQKSYVDIQINKRIVSAYEFDDLTELLSQINQSDSVIRQSLMRGLEKKLNAYLYSLISPSTSSPDHVLESKANLNADVLLLVRKAAAEAKWPTNKPFYGLISPQYYNDILGAQTLVSQDYIAGDMPTVGGKVVNQRFGFSLVEDNSLSGGVAYFFHPNFMHLAIAKEPQVKLSDLHAQKKFGYVLSADMILGAKQGINGSKMVIKVQTGA